MPDLASIDLRRLLDLVPTLHTLVERTDDGIVLRDVNAAVVATTGYTRDDVVGQRLEDLQPPEVVAYVRALIDRALDTGEVVTGDLDADTPVGAQRFGLTYVPVPEAGPGLVVSISIDRTEELRAERELDLTLRMAGLGSWSWDIANDAVVWSDEVLHLFGVDEETFGGTFGSFAELLHPEDRDAVVATIERAVAEGRPYDVQHRIVRPDGEVRHVSAVADIVRDARGGSAHVVGIVQDVTSRVREVQDGLTAERHAQALDLNDDVLQGLARARLHLVLGDPNAAMRAIDETAAAARAIVNELLGGPEGLPVRPGDLVRATPATPHDAGVSG